MKKQTDFERVLMNIATDTASSVFDRMITLDSSGWQLRFRLDRPAPQFIPLELAALIEMPLKKGDIVKCQTNPNHRWGISVFVEKLGYSNWLLQEIGGDKKCKMTSEGLEVLRFINSDRLYTGHQHQVFVWAHKAFSTRYNKQADRYLRRCGGVEFDGSTLIIWSRAHIWSMEKRDKNGTILYAQPRKFEMEWGKRTRLKDIVAAMNEQGFGFDFDFAPERPTDGQGGYITVTKKSLENTVYLNMKERMERMDGGHIS